MSKEIKPAIETTSLRKDEVVVDDIVNPVLRLHLPKLEKGHYYPSKANEYDDKQIEALEWLQYNSTHLSPEEILVNGVSRAPLSLTSQKFSDATPMEQYQVLKAMGYCKNEVTAFKELRKVLAPLVFNGTLTRDQESELIQTHYYEQIFKAIGQDVPMLNLTMGTLTGRAQTVRLLYQDAISFTYATEALIAEITPGANISRRVGTYSYRDVTMTSYALIAEIEDHLRRDAIQDPMSLEVHRLATEVNFFQEYQLGKKFFDSAGDSVNQASETIITLAEFRAGCAALNGLKTDGNQAVLCHEHYWTLMGDTAVGWYMYAGRETPAANGGKIPPLFGVQVYKEIHGTGYLDTATTGKHGIVADNRRSGFLVQRYPPIIEQFRIYERAAGATSMQWMIAAGLLDANAIVQYTS